MDNIYDDFYDEGNEETVIVEDKSLFSTTTSQKGYLVIIYGENLGKRFEITSDKLLIGRDLTSDIMINSTSVSRKHVLIYKGNGTDYLAKEAFWIRDLKSTNGTYIGEQAITEQELANGDVIKVGSTIFKFILGNDLETEYFEEIYKLTIIDGLTDIFNKRYFLENIEKEVSRCQRYSRPLSLIMFDIDFFKKINDNYGHLTGDYILKKLSKVVKDKIRREEIFARYGGEEFAIVMPESELKPAYILAEKLRKLIEETRFLFEGHVIPVTVSMGVSSLNKKVTTPFDLIAATDEKLYQAKGNGRNCVVS